MPFATTLDVEATTVELEALTGPTTTGVWKFTLAVCVMTRLLSVTSVAVNVSVPTVLDFTLKVTTPLALLVLLLVVIVALPLPAKETSLPATGLLPVSLRVTVMVEVEVPSAGTATGEADTVELVALTIPVEVANGVSLPV